MADGGQPDLQQGVDAARVGEGAMLTGRYGDDTVLLVRRNGRACALAATCTHLQAPLAEGRIEDGQLICPWHHARFDVTTGEAVAAPAFDPLARFEIEEHEGRIRVTGRCADERPGADSGRAPGRVVIIGGGAAGHACAELLTRAGHGRSVTVVSDDLDPPYDRTFLSKQYLVGGQVSREDCLLARSGFYDGVERATLRFARQVTSIEIDARRVTLDDGERLPFDTLVIATGAEPVRLDAPGLDHPDVHVLRTLHDADRIIAGAERTRHAVVVGASFIALEVAASLRQRGLEVDVVAPDEVPLGKLLGDEIGGMIRQVHEEKGVRFRLGRGVRGYDRGLLKLDDGSEIFTDLVVLGTGVTPRTALAEAAGLSLADAEQGGGIRVDAHLRTSAPRVYAIGDVANFPDARLGRRLRVEHWVHAERQGQHVARLLMGADAPFTDTPFFWSAHYDTGLRYLGHATADDAPRIEGDVAGRRFVASYGDAAVATCNRDADALAADVYFDRAARQRAGDG